MRPTAIFLILLSFGCSREKEPTLNQILNRGSDEFQSVLKNPSHEIQIIYGEISDDSIIHHHYNVEPGNFFYPASTVKMPVAFAAIQKLEELGLSLNTKLLIDSSEHNPRELKFDSLFNEEPTVRNLAKEIFTFSSNQAYNQLYGWLGKNYINELHHSMGLSSFRIIHQLSESAFSFTNESNRNTFKVTLEDDSQTLTFDPVLTDFEPTISPANQVRGVGYMNTEGEIINEPFDFTPKNFITLSDLLGCIERVVKPEFFSEDQQYDFSEETYDALTEILSMRPKDLPSPADSLPDNYVKFFMYGDQDNGTYPEHIDIFNKVGWAYGYLTDVAYIRDNEKNIEFFLSATIHVNENQIYNDGNYEYMEVGLPFLGELGRLVYDFESKK